MNEVIRQIQAQRDNCVSELWNPEATVYSDSECLGGTLPKYSANGTDRVGDLTIPRGLYDGVEPTSELRDALGRDSANNILVYWDANDGDLPSDNATCWMYVSRLNVWDQNY